MESTELEALAKQLNSCQDCPLRAGCQGTVGWFGNSHSPIMFVGEGPGGVEDDYGCPLIGPSGQLLDKALWASHMTRDRVLTTNVIKCRPKGNRTPTLQEGCFCAQRWLDKEIAIIKPKVIVALGSVALHYLGKPEDKITHTRGNWFKTKEGIDCLATFHPSYLLRLAGHEQVAAKWHVFYDLEKARAKVLEYRPDYALAGDKPIKLFSLFTKRT